MNPASAPAPRAPAVRRLALIALFLLLALAACRSLRPGREHAPERTWLTVIHFNDGESQLIDAGPGREDVGGLARFAAVVARIRSEVAADPRRHVSLTLSSGDNFLSGPEFGISLDRGPPYLDAIGLRTVGVDAMALGNHDFDFGPEVLAAFIRGFAGSPTRFLSVNLDVSEEPALAALAQEGVIQGSMVVERQGERFGIVGATTPNLPFLSSPRRVRVDHDVAGRVQEAVDQLEARGVNRIILISHLQGLGEDIDLLGLLRGVDLVIAGGGDELLANPGDPLLSQLEDLDEPIEEQVHAEYPIFARDAAGTRVPVVTTSGEYRYVGRLEVAFDSAGQVVEVGERSGPVRVVGGDRPDAVDPDPRILESVTRPLERGLAELDREIVGDSEVFLDGERNHIRAGETNLGDLVADALLWAARRRAAEFGAEPPLVALTNAGGIRNSIPAGPISILDTYQACPFPNFVTIVHEVTPRTLQGVLENACSRIAPDGGLAGASGTGRFAQVSGLRLRYDPRRRPGSRVREVWIAPDRPLIRGFQALDSAPSLTVATVGFLARGGDRWDLGPGRRVAVGMTMQQALAAFIAAPVEQGGLGGRVRATEYPPGGAGRILRDQTPAAR
jgi:5'-nucleotidase